MFTKWLNKKLFENEMSQRELSKKLEIHESLVSRWMSGEREPSLKNILALSKLFSVDIEEITKNMRVSK